MWGCCFMCTQKKFGKKGTGMSPTDPQHVNGQFPPTDPDATSSGRPSMDRGGTAGASASASSASSVGRRRSGDSSRLGKGDKGKHRVPSSNRPGSAASSPVTSPKGREDASLMDVDEDVTFRPAVFRWPYGGQQVYVTGTFNDWKAKIPLNKSGDDFIAIIDVTDEAHQYKVCVCLCVYVFVLACVCVSMSLQERVCLCVFMFVCVFFLCACVFVFVLVLFCACLCGMSLPLHLSLISTSFPVPVLHFRLCLHP